MCQSRKHLTLTNGLESKGKLEKKSQEEQIEQGGRITRYLRIKQTKKQTTQYTVKHITYTDTVCGKIHITATTKILEVIEPDEQVYIDHAAGTRHTVRDEISCYPGALAALKALKSYCE